MPLRLSWNRAGAGGPLLLLHGIGTTHDDFAALRPDLDAGYQVLAPDLPGHGESPPLDALPTVGAITDAVEADLDALGLGRVHVLGNSIGTRVALELARRHRARSVVAISPSGANSPGERLYQGVVQGGARLTLRAVRPLVPAATRSVLGRSALLAGLRAAPWRADETEATAVTGGFAGAAQFWRMLWWGILADVPTGLEDVDCPVILAQGTLDAIAVGQTPRYLAAVPGSRFVPLLGGGHAPQSDVPDAILRLVHEATAAATPADEPADEPADDEPTARDGTAQDGVRHAAPPRSTTQVHHRHGDMATRQSAGGGSGRARRTGPTARRSTGGGTAASRAGSGSRGWCAWSSCSA